MKQRLINFAVAISAVLAIVLLIFWIRSFYARDRIAAPIGSHYFVLTTFPQHFYLDRDDGWRGMPLSAQFGLLQIPSLPNYVEVRLIHRYAGAWSLAIPFWLPEMFLLVLPIWWAFTTMRNRHYKIRGLCPICGYDLRASPERCPECGTEVKQPQGNF